MVCHYCVKDCIEFHQLTFPPRISPEFHQDKIKALTELVSA